jgi:hypothetical protein
MMETCLSLLMKEANKSKHAVIRKTCQDVLSMSKLLAVPLC